MTKPDSRAADRLLGRVVLRGGGWVFVLAAATATTALAQVLMPAALGRAVDAVLAADDTSRWVAACAALIAVSVVADALGDLAAGMSRARATAWLRHALLGHILALGPRATRRHDPGDLVSRVIANADDAGNAAAAAAMAAAAALPAVGSLVALTLIDPWLAAAFLAGMALLAAPLRGFVREASDVTGRYQHVQGVISGRLLDALAGARTVAAAGTEDRETDRVLGPLEELHEHGMAMWRTQIRMTARGAAIVPLLEVAVLACGGLLLMNDRISAGQLLAAGSYAVMGSGLDAVVLFANRVVRGRAAARRAQEVLGAPPMAYGSRALPAGRSGLEFRRATARVDGVPVLKDVDLDVPAGATVAVVGRSGGGKSLLAALAGRLADPDEGEVLLDGVPLPQLGRAELRRAVGYAFERPALVGDTIADTIALGLPTTDDPPPQTPAPRKDPPPASMARARAMDEDALASARAAGKDAPAASGALGGAAGGDVSAASGALARAAGGDASGAVRAAARDACADGFVRRLPAGYGTALEAAPMSGGEAQRLGLARAFAQAERLLVLDDATSSLDTATELEVSGALLAGDRTRLVVAHRAATAARADKVAWIDEGTLRAYGPHRELWRDPAYRAVFAVGEAPP